MNEEVRIVERRERKGKELFREMVVLFKMKPEYLKISIYMPFSFKIIQDSFKIYHFYSKVIFLDPYNILVHINLYCQFI